MKDGFCPALLSCRLSDNYLNPRETLWVTMVWQNTGSAPAGDDYAFFLDGAFGHQRKIEGCAYDFRVTASSLPGTSRWLPGDTVTVTCKWTADVAWSGTFHLSVGLMDGEGVPLSISGPAGAAVRAYPVGDVDVSWNFGRPWVAAHRHPVSQTFADPVSPLPQRQQNAPVSICAADGIALRLSANRPRLLALGTADDMRPLLCGDVRVLLRSRGKDAVLREGCGDCRIQWAVIHTDERAVVYHAEAANGGEPAASFDLRWSVEGRTAKVTVENRVEYASYELLEVRYDSLAELQQGHLLDFYGAGREISIQDSEPAFFEKKYDTRNAAALYDDRMLALVESPHIDSLLTTGIVQVNGERAGIIGGSIVCRVRARGDMPSIPVQTPPEFTIEIPALAGERPTWKTAARLWRRGLAPNGAHELYRNTYFYKQLATWGPEPEEKWQRDPVGTTQNLFRAVSFREILENARKFARLTDEPSQILYIAGWQEHGFDTDYPEPYGAEPRCGGMDALRDVLGSGQDENIILSLHDNFDDISFDHASCPYTAMDENGQPWRGWVWAGGMTYIMGLKKYVSSGAARERIDRMKRLLPLHDTYHLDVLSAEVCRYDFDPAHPASAQDSLDAKLKIIEEFNRHGLDVTSEMLSHAFIGKIGFALHTRIDTESHYLPGDRFVPLAQMIYHGIIGYCAPGRTVKDMLWAILLGGQTFYEEDITGPLCVGRYYLQNIPAMRLYGRRMLDFEEENGKARAIYEGNSCVTANFNQEKYEIVVDGQLIGKDFTTFTQGNHPGVWLAYSLRGGEMRYPVPPALVSARGINAAILTEDGVGAAVQAWIEDGEIMLRMPKETPVRISSAANHANKAGGKRICE